MSIIFIEIANWIIKRQLDPGLKTGCIHFGVYLINLSISKVCRYSIKILKNALKSCYIQLQLLNIHKSLEMMEKYIDFQKFH